MQVAELWRLLRRAVLHYIRGLHPSEGELRFTLETREAARDSLRQYANGLQQHVSAQCSFLEYTDCLRASNDTCRTAGLHEHLTKHA